MKILFFNQYFATPKGSYGTRAYEFAKRWVAAGHQVSVITSVYERSDIEASGFLTRLTVEGVDVRVLNIRQANRHGFILRVMTFLMYAFVATWFALTEKADVVLCSSGPITVGIPGLAARWVRRLPMVFEVRDLWPEGAIQLGILQNRTMVRLARWFEALCYRSASLVVALSPDQAAHIQTRIEDLICETVPNAADNEFADTLPEGDPLPSWAVGKHLAIYGGAIGLINDCGQFLRLGEELRARGRDDITIVILGEGSERPRLERESEEKSLTNIRFLGPRPRTEVFQWLKRADLSLFTVKNVPFLDSASPNKVFDAFAVGIPMVQTTQGWLKELFEEEACGFTVPIGDTAEMADAVEALVGSSELRHRMGANAKRLAREQFGRSILASTLLAHMKTVAESK
jgi:glycosyltransferase involved in cell wall biosynthesis